MKKRPRLTVKDDAVFCEVLHPLLWNSIKKNDVETATFLLNKIYFNPDWLVQPMYAAIRNGNKEIIHSLFTLDNFTNYCFWGRLQYQFFNLAMEYQLYEVADYIRNLYDVGKDSEDMKKYNHHCVKSYELFMNLWNQI